MPLQLIYSMQNYANTAWRNANRTYLKETSKSAKVRY